MPSDRIEPLICSACDGSGIDGSHDAALYYADRGELSPCPNCDGTGNRIEPLFNCYRARAAPVGADTRRLV